MSDSEKLDKQRLKNFKNKGRDLEVKPCVTSSRFTDTSRIIAQSSPLELSYHAALEKCRDPSVYMREERLNQSKL